MFFSRCSQDISFFGNRVSYLVPGTAKVTESIMVLRINPYRFLVRGDRQLNFLKCVVQHSQVEVSVDVPGFSSDGICVCLDLTRGSIKYAKPSNTSILLAGCST